VSFCHSREGGNPETLSVGVDCTFRQFLTIKGPEKDWNAISLCPNCSTIFDEVIRPILHNALSKFGVTNLPHSWEKDNKISSESQKGKRA
jgi:hypothetical protein